MILIDTSVYVGALTDNEVENIIKEAAKREFVMSSEVIEKEIELASDFLKRKGKKDDAQKLKDLYIRSISGTIRLTERVLKLSHQYSTKVKDNISKTRSKEMKDDFRIVSSAVIGSVEAIATFNRKTMSNPDIVAIYKEINDKNDLKTPRFIKTKEELLKFLPSV